jgi:FlaA1/EpsC-like NDP-sugar epimerase
MRLLRVNPRTLVAATHDLIWVLVIWIGTYQFRLSLLPDESGWRLMFTTLPVVILIQMACFFAFGLYRGIWRYASLHDIARVAAAVGVSAALVPVVILMWRYGQPLPPRSVFILDPLLLLLFMGGGRIAYRWFKDRQLYAEGDTVATPVLLLGAGNTAIRLLDELRRRQGWRIVGLLDDNRNKQHREIAGMPVLGSWDDIAQVTLQTDIRHAILAVSSIDHQTRRRAYQLCEAAGIRLLLPPPIEDLMSGRVTVSQVREVELDDLLGRDEVQLDTAGLDQLLGAQVVLVTGAGGSIGSELCRQIARFQPTLLLLLEQSEFALYTMEQEFARAHPQVAIQCLIGDVKDTQRLDEIFARFRPRVIFHAAAYKHVPLMEQSNAWEAVRNNVLGTWQVLQAVSHHGADKFVFVSTDKAVNPTSVMGASKRLAEMLLQRWCQSNAIDTVIVRFGNVLGSTGSVVPKFKEQIARGGPLTVTHPEIRRYFMSVPEACRLVLQAGFMGHDGQVFVLDMGEPVRILDLARDLIRLSGFSEEEIRIEFSGLRPGEKLYEELLASDENSLPTPHPKLRVAKVIEAPDSQWEQEVLSWLTSNDAVGPREVRATLNRFIPEYSPYPETSKVVPLPGLPGARSA